MVIGNPAILEQSHAHNAPDLWDRGSMLLCNNTAMKRFCLCSQPMIPPTKRFDNFPPLRNLLTRWDVSSIPANGIFLTKN